MADPSPVGRLLTAARDRAGRRPLSWAVAPLRDAGRVLDLCCAEGALRAHLPSGRRVGVDPAAGPERPRVRDLPDALPPRSKSVDGIALLLALPALPRLDAVFAELRRVLRPAGMLILLVPSASPRSLAELRSPLRAVHCGGWAQHGALDRAGWLLAAADFAVLGDERIGFTLPPPDADSALALARDLPRAGLWPPRPPSAQVRQALLAAAGPGARVPVPLRRLTARR